MKSSFKTFMGILFLCLAWTPAIGQLNYTWTGGTGNWSEASNWSPAGVPAGTDTAVITADGTYTVTLDADATVPKIVLGGSSGTQTLYMTQRSLTVNEELMVNSNGHLSIRNTTLAGTGPLLNSGAFTSYDGIIDLPVDNYASATFQYSNNINSTLSTHPNSSIHIDINTTNNHLAVANGFTNHGLIYFTNHGSTSSGVLEVTSGTLVNAPDGIIEGKGPVLYAGSYNAIEAPLDNQGLVEIDQGFALELASAAHTNSGTFHVLEGGIFYLMQSGTNPSFTTTGTFTLDTLTAMNIYGGLFDYQGDIFHLKGAMTINTGSVVQFSDTLSNTGTISLTGSTLTVHELLSNSNIISSRNATLNGDGLFSNMGTFTSYDCTLDLPFDNYNIATFQHLNNINNTLITHPGSNIHIDINTTNNRLIVANGFTNHGLVYFTNHGSTSSGILEVTSGTLVNAPDGVIEGKGPVLYAGSFNAIEAPLDNQGLVEIDQGFGLELASAVHTNTGTFRVLEGGIFYLMQSGTDPSFTTTGTFTMDTLTALYVYGGLFDYQADIFHLKGSMIINTGSVVQFSDTLSSTGTISLTGSTLTVHELLSNSNIISSRNATLNGDGLFSNMGTFTSYDCTLDLPVDNYGVATFQYSNQINNTLTTHANSSIHLDINTTSNHLTVANGFTNHGLIYFTNHGTTSRGFLELSSGTLVNAPDGVIESKGSSLYPTYSNGIEAPVDNQGLITNTKGLSIGIDGATHINSGTIIIEKDFINMIGASLENQASGLIGGKGTLNISSLNFTNSGSISPGLSPGLLTINGHWDQSSTGVYKVEIGGTSVVDTLYDILATTGDIVLDGSMDISLVEDFLPAVGDTFDVLSYTSASGAFSNFTGLNTGEGISFEVDQTSAYLRLTAIETLNSPPAAFDLLLPQNGSTLPTLDTIRFEWKESTDADGDALSYSLQITGTALDTTIDQISTLWFTITDTDFLEHNASYSWSVSASDGDLEQESTSTFTFTTPEDNTSGIGHQLAGIAFLKQIYPNPFNTTVNLEFTNLTPRELTMEIYNLNGQQIGESIRTNMAAGGQIVSVNLEWLPEGIYLFKFTSGDEYRMERVVKLRGD